MSSFPPNSEPLQTMAYASRGTEVIDREHLKVLAICHYVWAGLLALFSCFGLLYLVMGVAMAIGKFGASPAATSRPVQPVSDQFVGMVFIVMGSMMLVCGWSLAFCTIVSGRKIARHRGRVFSIIIAALNCMLFPFGTTLGVFTLIVLLRHSVQMIYEEERLAQPNSGNNVAT